MSTVPSRRGPRPPAGPPTLRVFTPATSEPDEPADPPEPPEPKHPHGLGPDMTWPQLFDRFASSLYATARPAHLEKVRIALDRFAEYAGRLSIRATTDRVIQRLQAKHARRKWRGKLVSANTRRGDQDIWRRLLLYAAPRDRYHNAQAASEAGLYGWEQDAFGRWRRREAPAIVLPAKEETEPRPLELSEIVRWLDAVGRARVPPKVTPAWIQSVILFGHNTGMRIETVFGLRWSMISADGLWADCPAEIMKRRRPHRFYLNAAARRAMGPRGRRDDRVFDWPYDRKTQDGKYNYWHAVQRRILKAAGLEGAPQLHGLRKGLNDWLVEHRYTQAAKLQLGHSLGSDVNLKHYTSRRILPRAMEKVPQPPGYELADETPPDPQLRLF